MLVLHILTSREQGRAENFAANLICGLQEAGIAQGVVLHEGAPSYDKLQKAGIEMVPRVLRARWRWRQRFLLRGLIRRMKPDIIHCWTRAAARLVPPGKIPVIGWLAGYDDPRHFDGCKYFVGATADIATHLIRCGTPRPNVHAIPVFSAITSSPPLDRNLLATPREAKVLLSLARLHPDSRLDILLAALADLPGCYAWLAGEGPLRRELEMQANDMGILDRVRFADTRLDHGALLRAADLCVLPAPDEPLGTIVQDAWVGGTPLIAAATADFAAPIEDDADGLLVASGDPAAIAQAIRRALDDDGLRRRLVAQGYATGLGLYAREAVVRQWAGLYREIRGQGSGIRD